MLANGDDQVIKRGDKETVTNPQIWEFGDMKIQFVPSTWDIIVSVINSVGECQFSSLSGGDIISSIFPPSTETSSSTKTGTAKKHGPNSAKPKAIKHDTSTNNLAAGKDLASLNADLDVMLANIKNFKGNN